MRLRLAFLLGGFAALLMPAARAQGSGIKVPTSVEAGSAFSIQTTGTGKGVLYIVSPAQALRRDVQLGETVTFPAGTLYNSGHYLVILAAGEATENGAFDVLSSSKPATLSFLAKPSRLPVSLQNGITGAVYVFDAYQNLVTKPLPISFALSNLSSPVQARTVTTRDGAAWTEMNSGAKEGAAKFVANAGGVSSERIIQQVPGDPCSLRITARPAGQNIALQTDPVRDCGGNAIPDGTIVTFTETYNGNQSTVDVPLKRGIAQVELPARRGAKISAASGIVMGNEIRWGG
ncbi:hypothetical protein [Acidobacterium sp. S8]|uniref:hypothetical protein n=1 Tax=Acidobacterium sp. S8 TaxID=1641854 RepID=UPI0020B10A37|nr:hypothetical protein [Acidobacterium sp. S8]